jgi:type I restriction enzyme S subunit
MSYTDMPAIPPGWSWAFVGDVLRDIQAGKSLAAQDRPALLDEWGVLKLSAVTWGTFNPDENKALPKDFVPPPSFEVRAGDLLISRANTKQLIGAVVLVETTRPRLMLSDKTLRLIPNEHLITKKYLQIVLSSPVARKHIESNATGTSDSMRNISQDVIREIPIPLPPLPEQRRIAAVLAKADRLRRLRRYALELSAGYLQAVFVEMFGDPVTNPRGWDVVPFEEVCDIDAKLVDPRLETYRYLPHIGGTNIESVTGNISRLQTAEQERLISSKFLIEPHHILFSKIRPRLRKVAFPKIRALCSADIYPITIDTDCCEILYMLYYLRSDHFSKIVAELAESRTNIPKVNREELADTFIPVPPISLQQRFATVTERHDRLHAQQREALRQAEHLFDTLLHRAFRGELGAGDERAVEALAAQPSGGRAEEALAAAPAGDLRQARLEL